MLYGLPAVLIQGVSGTQSTGLGSEEHLSTEAADGMKGLWQTEQTGSKRDSLSGNVKKRMGVEDSRAAVRTDGSVSRATGSELGAAQTTPQAAFRTDGNRFGESI